MTVNDLQDRRARRTRMAIFTAFRDLVLRRNYDGIRVADIIETAEIGRSTFYEHFNNKDDVLLTSIEPLFAPLAQIPAGRGDREQLQFVLEHFWEQRRFARLIFRDAIYEKLTRKLADMIETDLSIEEAGERRLQALAAASAMLGVIRGWVTGEFSMSAEAFATRLLQMAL